MIRRIPKGLERVRLNRVKTGCLTCEIRNLRCDEEKPTCQQCRLGGMKCEGYERPNPRAPCQQQQAILCRRRKPQNDPCRASSIQFPVTSLDISGSWLEKFLFHHVRASTIKDLGQSTSLVKFWSRYVLPLGHNVEPIKHALIALGAAHRCFQCGDGLEFCSRGEQNYHNIAIKHYNLAISHLNSIMLTPSQTNMQITLVCCLIFVCLENIRGQYSEALRHLRAGSRLLGSLWRGSETEPSAARSKGMPAQEELARRNSDFDQLCKIADMFSRLGSDAAIYVEDTVVSMVDLEVYTHVADEEISKPFISADAAQDHLFSIDRDMDLLFEQIDYNYDDGMPIWKREEKLAYYALQDRFNAWIPRFNLYMDNIPSRLVSAEEFKQAMILSIHKQVLYCIFKQGPDFEGTLHQRDLEEIVDQVEPLIKPRTPSAHPVFTFDAELLPPLSYVCTFSTDVNLRKRAVSLLQSANRREGIWDSRELASIYEATCVSAERGMQIYDLTKQSFLESVKELSSTGLLKLGSTSSVMRLAESGEFQCWSKSPESDKTTESSDHDSLFSDSSEPKTKIKCEMVQDLIGV